MLKKTTSKEHGDELVFLFMSNDNLIINNGFSRLWIGGG